MQKKKLLVILGAGSSLAHGMPSVSELNSLLLDWSQEWLQSHPDHDNYYQNVHQNAAKYSGHIIERYQRPTNYEYLLGDLAELANWLKPSPFGNPLRLWMAQDGLPVGMKFPKHGTFEEFFCVNAQATNLLTRWANNMRSRCQKIDTTTTQFSRYKGLVGGLREFFDVGIFNLNYDNVALNAWPDAFTGFSNSGQFEPSCVHRRNEWGFIYHLHGSVHHRLLEIKDTLAPFFTEPQRTAICWESDLSKAVENEDSDGRRSLQLSDGKLLPRTTLISGRFKLDQLLIDPYQSFYAALVRHIYEADAVMIGGYGLADPHVNHVLQNRWTESGQMPPLLILTKADDGEQPLLCRKDAWGSQFRNIFRLDTQLFSRPSGLPGRATVSQIRDDSTFEVSNLSQAPVATWYGGFYEVIVRLDAIVRWLDGDRLSLPR